MTSPPRVLRRFIINLLVIFPATLVLLIVLVNTIQPTTKPSASDPAPSLASAYHPAKDFNAYWYDNKAELNRYELSQARYGEIREGEAVLIFVTEHHDPAKHLKTNNESGNDIPVMKLNHVRKFQTGIYPYSTMSSVFTPVNVSDNPNSLRTSFSSQEWCGQVWSILDLRGSQYRGQVNSYFLDEGDFGVSLEAVLLEDEVFNRLRIDPASLPEGEISIIPAQLHLRLMHKEYRIYHADAKHSRTTGGNGEKLSTYEIAYTDLDRTVTITYETDFPRMITGWEETHKDGFGANARELTTTARLANSMMLDYWRRNSVADTVFQIQFGTTGN